MKIDIDEENKFLLAQLIKDTKKRNYFLIRDFFLILSDWV
jgi:hypothetical protein